MGLLNRGFRLFEFQRVDFTGFRPPAGQPGDFFTRANALPQDRQPGLTGAKIQISQRGLCGERRLRGIVILLRLLLTGRGRRDSLTVAAKQISIPRGIQTGYIRCATGLPRTISSGLPRTQAGRRTHFRKQRRGLHFTLGSGFLHTGSRRSQVRAAFQRCGDHFRQHRVIKAPPPCGQIALRSRLRKIRRIPPCFRQCRNGRSAAAGHCLAGRQHQQCDRAGNDMNTWEKGRFMEERSRWRYGCHPQPSQGILDR